MATSTRDDSPEPIKRALAARSGYRCSAYPVVWCDFPVGNHADPNYMGVNYPPAP